MKYVKRTGVVGGTGGGAGGEEGEKNRRFLGNRAVKGKRKAPGKKGLGIPTK